MDKYKLIDEEIKKYNNIVIARHVRPDLDALGSQLALKYSLSLKYPDKNIVAVGATSSVFNFLPKLDKEQVYENTLLIVLDNPNFSRIDVADYSKYTKIIKIDHHPLIDTFSDVELIETNKSSTCEVLYDLFKALDYPFDSEIASYLIYGMITDTGRFLFSLGENLLVKANDLITTYDLDMKKIYQNIYLRSLKDVKFEGYIINNFNITKNNMASIIIEEDKLNLYDVDQAVSGNVINNFTNIKELLVWSIATYDKNKKTYKISVRSRGPIVNKVCEMFNGGGHPLASGAVIEEKEEIEKLFNLLDKECERYKYENN